MLYTEITQFQLKGKIMDANNINYETELAAIKKTGEEEQRALKKINLMEKPRHGYLKPGELL